MAYYVKDASGNLLGMLPDNIPEVFTGATLSLNGRSGLVPTPLSNGDVHESFLCEDGSWKKPADNDTKVTNVPSDDKKAYITGTVTGNTSTDTQVFDTGVFLGPNPGELYASKFVGSLVGDLDGNAVSATSAVRDGSGNIITATYLTKMDKVTDAQIDALFN